MKAKRKPKKLKSSPNTSLAIVIFSGVLGVMLAFFLSRPDASEARPIPVRVASDFDTMLIPTPSRAIARGEKIADIPITTIKWPENSVTSNYIQDTSAWSGAVVITPLSPYVPIPLASISSQQTDTNAVVEGIPDGMRAITVKVDAESAVEGWARSGNFVDVILIRSTKDSGLESQIIAENVRILSAGSSTTPVGTDNTSTKAPQTVTLLVTQEDSLKIKTATSLGKLTFALRGKNDQAPTNIVAMNQQHLLGEKRSANDQPTRYNGYATGPNGERYALRDNNHWVSVSTSLGNDPGVSRISPEVAETHE